MANEATKPHGAGDKCEDCHGTGEVDLIDGHEQPCAACMSREFAVKYAAQSAELEQLHRDFDALVDHLKDAIGDDLKAHVDPIIGYVDEDLTRAVVAMRAELEHLRAENARLKAPVSDLAKEIVTRIVTDTITLQWIRNIADALSDKVDADDEPTEKTLLADALALALGDDIGCMDEDDEDFRERVCLYWLEDKLAARAHEPQKEINDAE